MKGYTSKGKCQGSRFASPRQRFRRVQQKGGGLGKNLVEAAFGMTMPRGSRKLALSRMSMGGAAEN